LRSTLEPSGAETDPFASLGAFDEFVGAHADLDLEEILFYWPPLGEALAGPPAEGDEARLERIAAQRITSRPELESGRP
jgi:hypothetical protein